MRVPSPICLVSTIEVGCVNTPFMQVSLGSKVGKFAFCWLRHYIAKITKQKSRSDFCFVIAQWQTWLFVPKPVAGCMREAAIFAIEHFVILAQSVHKKPSRDYTPLALSTCNLRTFEPSNFPTPLRAYGRGADSGVVYVQGDEVGV